MSLNFKQFRFVSLVAFAAALLFGLLYFAIPMKASAAVLATFVVDPNTTGCTGGWGDGYCEKQITTDQDAKIICFQNFSAQTTEPNIYLDLPISENQFEKHSGTFNNYSPYFSVKSLDLPAGSHSIIFSGIQNNGGSPYRQVAYCTIGDTVGSFNRATDVMEANSASEFYATTNLTGINGKKIYSFSYFLDGSGSGIAPNYSFDPDQDDYTSPLVQAYSQQHNFGSILNNFTASSDTVQLAFNFFNHIYGSDWAVNQTFIFDAKSGGGDPDPGGGLIDASTVSGLYFRFNEVINSCPINTSCKIGYSFDQAIFGPAATGKLYYYQNSTAERQDLGTINLNSRAALGIYGIGYVIASSTTPTTGGPSYYEIVPNSDRYNADMAPSIAAVFFLGQEEWQEILEGIIKTGDDANVDNILGVDTRALACSETDWNSESEWLGMNFTKSMCSLKKWLLDISLSPLEMARDKVSAVRERVMNVFPLSIFKKIQDEWNGAISLLSIPAANAAEGSFDEESGVYSGDFSFTTTDFIGEGETTFVLMSKDSMENLLGVDGFLIFNIVCRLLLWTAFFVYLWDLLTHRVHTEMTN